MTRQVSLVAVVVVLLVVGGATVGTAGRSAGTHDRSSDEFTPISECQVITEPGHYRLVEDITNSSEIRCINIQASNVTFDGAGHTIDGIDDYLFTSDEGIETSTKGVLAKDGPNTNVTVKNVEVTDYGYGLWFGETSHSRIVNNTFRSNGIYGIYLGYDATNNTVADNRVRNITNRGANIASGKGIVLAHHADGNEIVGNDVRGSEKFGIEVVDSDRTRIADNRVMNSGRHGITGGGAGTEVVNNSVTGSQEIGINLADANRARIIGNEVVNNGRGIDLARADEGFISNNRVVNSGGTGIRGGGDGTVIANNVVERNTDHGIHLEGGTGSSNITIVENHITDNNENGILVADNTTATTIRRNVVTDNAKDGISVGVNATATTIRRNNVSTNSDRGVRVIRSSGTVLGNNSISDNRLGIVLGQLENTTVRRNTVGNNSEDGILVRGATTARTTRIHENRITGNSLTHHPPVALNATYNYWGASDGPSGTFDASGAAVFGNVTVRPFYTDPALTTVSSVPGDGPTVRDQPATDPDDDGRYEDVNGDGTFDIFDVQAFLDTFGTDPVQTNPAAFNFDGSGGVNIFDVQALLDEV